MRQLKGSGLLVALLLLSVGCDCGGTTTQTRLGSLVVVEPGTGGGVAQEATFPVGFVPGGSRGSVAVELRNIGQGSLSLAGLERVEGDALSADATPTAEAPFALEWTRDATMESGGSTLLTAHFLAPAGTEQTEWRVVLRLLADGAAEGQDGVTLTLTATTASVACEVPSPLSAGAVMTRTSRRMGLTLTNTFPTPQLLRIGTPTGFGSDPLAFVPAEGTVSGEVWLEAGEAVELAWDFQPTEVRTYAASVELQRADSCPPQELRLEGEGVDRLLTWSPQTLEFGVAWPGTSVERGVVFRNASLEPITVSAFSVVSASAPFAPAASVGASLVVPAAGEATLPLVFSPTEPGSQAGVFRFQTSLPEQPLGQVAVRGFGGGPAAAIAPNPLTFGAVAWFPAAPAVNVHRRRLLLSNVGTTIEQADPRNHLFLGTPDASGAFAGPYFLVTPLDGLTAPGEFSLELGDDFDPAVGLPAVSGSNRRALQVVFRPTGPGPRSALLSLYTNDPRNPVVDVELHANVVVVPPCRSAVRPVRLDFGILRPEEVRTLEVEVVNLGSTPEEHCLISEVDLTEGTDGAFSLPVTWTEAQQLAPGASMKIPVRLTAGNSDALLARLGALTYRVSSPTESTVQVPLSGLEGRSCLLLAPDVLEFGTQAVGCGSAARATAAYNVCESDIVLKSIELTHAAGQLPGGPECAGSAPCAEFTLTGLPAIPAGGLRLAPGEAVNGVAFRYRPLDFGRDQGLVMVTFTQGSTEARALVLLGGAGDTVGANVDVFQEGGQPIADILLTIDGSCSMIDEQTQLASNLGEFFTELTQRDVDFHIAVIAGAAPTSSFENGLFLTGATHPDAVLTRDSPDVLNQFREKVLVGVSTPGAERCLEPSYTSLTAAHTQLQNRGFLRPDAPLSIICITDEPDQDPIPVAQHLASFRGLKRSANLFNVNAIAPFDDKTCGPGDDGRLRDAVDLSGGVRAELCNAAWAPTLRDIGKRASGARNRYVLTSPADASQPIDVVIDGTSIPRTEPSGAENWSYDPVTNVLSFTPFAVPEPGTSLEVRYTAVCQ